MKPYPHCQVLCLWVNGLDQTLPIRHVCCSECQYRGNCHLWASHTAVGRMLERYGFKRWWWGLFDEVSSTIAFLQVTPQPCAVTQHRSLLATTCCNYHFSSPFLLHNPKSEFGPFPFHIWETLFCIHALYRAPQGKHWYCPFGTAQEHPVSLPEHR